MHFSKRPRLLYFLYMKCLLFHFCTWECLGTLQSYIETSKKPKKGQKLLENILKLQCDKKKISGPTCITLENMLPKSSRQRISGGHTKLSFSHISFRIKGKPENTCGTNMCDKRFQEKRPPQLQKAHCLKMIQKVSFSAKLRAKRAMFTL